MFVHIQVKEDKIKEFKEVFNVNIEGTRNEPGNIRFDLLQDFDDPKKFVVYEVYDSEESLHEHRKTKHYKQTVERLEDIMEGPRHKDIYHGVVI